MDITVADSVILVGVIQAFFGLFGPESSLKRLRLDSVTLIITGVLVSMAGLVVKVVLE